MGNHESERWTAVPRLPTAITSDGEPHTPQSVSVVGLVMGAHVYGTLPPPMVGCESGSIGDEPSSLHDAIARDKHATVPRVQRTNVRCAIFDFAGRIFHEAADERPGRDMAAFLELRPDTAFIGAISVLWRTVQRYGMRGHRYCVVDAACVVSNLVEFARDAGDDPVCIGPARCAAAARLMDLPASTPVVAGMNVGTYEVEIDGDEAYLADAAGANLVRVTLSTGTITPECSSAR